jgi:hypothetical protein
MHNIQQSNDKTKELFEGIAKSDKFTVDAAHKAFANLYKENITVEDNEMTQHQAKTK